MTTQTHTPDTLAAMNLPELRETYEAIVGEPTKAPNKKFLTRRILEAQEAKAAESKEELPTETAPEPQEQLTTEPQEDEPTNPWTTAPDLDARLALIRTLASTQALDALLATTPDGRAIGTRVVTEANAQRAALAKVEEAEAPALRAILGNKQTHRRPGLLDAVKARLEGLAESSTEEERPLGDLSVEELQAAYETEVGRTTGSTHKGYLIWKIREARKGRITVGAVKRAEHEPGVELKVVSLRFEVSRIEAIDAAWQAGGYSSRMAFVREVLGEKVGAHKA